MRIGKSRSLRIVSIDAGNVAKVIGAIAALVAAVGGFWVAVGTSDTPQAPAVIIIRGSTLPEDDGLTDSEKDREWVWDESS
jgi:hypothetical protein